MDAVTGLSGSGPGFVFAFMEALEEAGVEQAFDRDTARAMAIATVRGAGELAAREAAKAGGADPAELRRRVSSKGGTTLAGLAAMEEKGFSAAARAAVAAATARSAELGKG
jgi:pyrroline-5-carboxylate reductase